MTFKSEYEVGHIKVDLVTTVAKIAPNFFGKLFGKKESKFYHHDFTILDSRGKHLQHMEIEQYSFSNVSVIRSINDVVIKSGNVLYYYKRPIESSAVRHENLVLIAEAFGQLLYQFNKEKDDVIDRK